MIEAAGLRHRLLKGFLAGMSEGWMTDVVRQAQGFRQVLVEAQRPGNGSADLRDLETVGQPNAEMVPVRRNEDLGLVPQPAKRNAMNDPVAITLKIVPRSAIWSLRFRMAASRRAGRVGSVRGQVHRPRAYRPG